MKSFPENRLQIKVHNNQIFFKLFSSRDELPVFVEHEAVAIENKFVLTTNKVVVSDDDRVIGGASSKHALTPLTFSSVIRRRENTDNDFGADRQCQLEYTTIRIPDVLANTHADSCSIQLKDGAAIARLKVSKFIEDSVIRQINLVICRDEFAVLRNGRRIENIVGTIDKPDNDCDIAATDND